MDKIKIAQTIIVGSMVGGLASFCIAGTARFGHRHVSIIPSPQNLLAIGATGTLYSGLFISGLCLMGKPPSPTKVAALFLLSLGTIAFLAPKITNSLASSNSAFFKEMTISKPEAGAYSAISSIASIALLSHLGF